MLAGGGRKCGMAADARPRQLEHYSLRGRSSAGAVRFAPLRMLSASPAVPGASHPPSRWPDPSRIWLHRPGWRRRGPPLKRHQRAWTATERGQWVGGQRARGAEIRSMACKKAASRKRRRALVLMLDQTGPPPPFYPLVTASSASFAHLGSDCDILQQSRLLVLSGQVAVEGIVGKGGRLNQGLSHPA